MRKLYFFGDSHCQVYRYAAINAGRTDILGGHFLGGGTLQREFFTLSDGKITFLGEAAENFKGYCEKWGIKDLTECRQALVVSMGLAAAPFYGTRSWIHHHSIAPDSRPNRMILSQAIVGQIVADLQRPVLEFYEWLHEHDLIFAVVPSPRPQRRHAAIEALGVDRVLRLVEVFERPVRSKLKQLGSPIIDLPGTLDADGLLSEEYWGLDASHGNAAYGKLVLEQLDRLSPPMSA